MFSKFRCLPCIKVYPLYQSTCPIWRYLLGIKVGQSRYRSCIESSSQNGKLTSLESKCVPQIEVSTLFFLSKLSTWFEVSTPYWGICLVSQCKPWVSRYTAGTCFFVCFGTLDTWRWRPALEWPWNDDDAGSGRKGGRAAEKEAIKRATDLECRRPSKRPASAAWCWWMEWRARRRLQPPPPPPRRRRTPFSPPPPPPSVDFRRRRLKRWQRPRCRCHRAATGNRWWCLRRCPRRRSPRWPCTLLPKAQSQNKSTNK